MRFRPYDPETDRDAAQRIWRECGWLDDERAEELDLFIAASRARVAEIDGVAECLVLTSPATLRHLREDLPTSAVTGVTTSHIARRQGFAGRLTALALAEDAADGALVSALGMFEQGFYDRLGFGSGAYEHTVSFGPSSLRVEPGRRVPRRLTRDDWEIMHDNRLRRRRAHGSCSLLAAGITRADLAWTKRGFGLGFADGPDGRLTHHFWMSTRDDIEHGPFRIAWMAYETTGQLLELMGVVKSLGDQIHAVRMTEPPGIQLQDLVEKPFERRAVTMDSKFDSRTESFCSHQVRICDLAGCLDATRLAGSDEVRFNLELVDPIERLLPDDAPWRGAAGRYVVTLGPTCGAEPGVDDALPAMRASVNAFTRLWLGVRPASGLAATDDLDAPPDLLKRLDDVVRLPVPMPDWHF